MVLKNILQIIAIIFLLHGIATAFIIKNETGASEEEIKKTRVAIVVTNVLIWGGVIIAINIFM